MVGGAVSETLTRRCDLDLEVLTRRLDSDLVAAEGILGGKAGDGVGGRGGGEGGAETVGTEGERASEASAPERFVTVSESLGS